MRVMCQLRGSENYCEIGRGICCKTCDHRASCEKACMNDPARCGYSQSRPPNYVLPVPRPWKGEIRRADTDQET